MSLYSHIVILGTSFLFAGDLLPIHSRTTYSLSPPVWQAVLPTQGIPAVAPSGPLISQQHASGLKDSKASGTVFPAAAVPTSDPPFRWHPIQFAPNSLALDIAARNSLKRASAWLQRHRQARILIVGSCDAEGSETCTRAFAEARGAVVWTFLGRSGLASEQIVGVKGWDNLDQSCRSSDIECQRVNRSAQIFAASSVAPQKRACPMRGSITRVSRKDGSGCILSEGGKEICFERSEASSNEVEELRVGHRVEFELQYGFERPCAVNVRRLQRAAGQTPGNI